MALRHRVSAAIRHHRQVSNLSQKALAERAGLSLDMVARIEAGADPDSKTARAPSLDALEALAGALGVPVAALVPEPAPAELWARALLAAAGEPQEALRALATAIDEMS